MQQCRRKCFTSASTSGLLFRRANLEVTLDLLEEVRQARQLPERHAARLIRVMAGVSQTRLAAELGVHRNTVIRWESGERKPRGALRQDYASLLDELRRAAS